MDVSLTFYNEVDDSVICHIVLYNAVKSHKTLSPIYAYATVKTFYVRADLICCEAYV